MNKITFRHIRFSELWAAENIDVLLDEYAEECAIVGMPKPEADRAMYEAMESSGAVLVIGAFSEDVLAGFVVLLVYRNPHYSQVIAVTESIFVASQYRKTGAGRRLISEAEAIAKERGAAGILVSAPADSRLAKVMPGIGYNQTNVAFFRGLR